MFALSDAYSDRLKKEIQTVRNVSIVKRKRSREEGASDEHFR